MNTIVIDSHLKCASAPSVLASLRVASALPATERHAAVEVKQQAPSDALRAKVAAERRLAACCTLTSPASCAHFAAIATHKTNADPIRSELLTLLRNPEAIAAAAYFGERTSASAPCPNTW